MKTNPHDVPLLHVFAQQIWHATANVVGNRKALERLKAAVDDAINTGHGFCEAFTNDGEGFEVVVTLTDDATIDTLAVPYVDEVAQGGNNEAKWPFDLPGVLDFYLRKREESRLAYEAKKAKEQAP